MKIIDWIIWILGFGFLLIPTYLLIFTDSNPWIVAPFYFIFTLFLSVKLIDKKKKLNLPNHIYLLGLLAVYLNMNGEFFFALYYRFQYYDKFLHFIVPLYLAFIAKLFIKKDSKYGFFKIVLFVFSLCIMWEFFEYFVDAFSGTTIMQGVVINTKILSGGVEDTIFDLAFSFIGSIVGAFLALKLNFSKKKKH